jgi:hypothetical protein
MEPPIPTIPEINDPIKPIKKIVMINAISTINPPIKKGKVTVTATPHNCFPLFPRSI